MKRTHGASAGLDFEVVHPGVKTANPDRTFCLDFNQATAISVVG
jgi:hypothetical protein